MDKKALRVFNTLLGWTEKWNDLVDWEHQDTEVLELLDRLDVIDWSGAAPPEGDGWLMSDAGYGKAMIELDCDWIPNPTFCIEAAKQLV